MLTVRETPRGAIIEISSYNPTLGARIAGLPDGRRLWVARTLADEYRPASGGWCDPLSDVTSLTPADLLREEAEDLLRRHVAGRQVRVLRQGGITA